MLPGQMSPLQLESVLDVHRNLPLKFHQIGSVAAEILLMLSLCGGLGGWRLQSHFVVKPNRFVEVRLGF